VFLGFAAFFTRVVHVPGISPDDSYMVLSTVTHVAVGALLLATTVVLTVQVWRLVAVARRQEAPEARTITA